MAASSSDEGSIAPKDFQQLSASSESVSRLSPNLRKCPLCGKFRKTFYCRDCFHNGTFCNSKLKSTDRYIDRKKILLEWEDRRKTAEKNYLRLLENKREADVVQSDIKCSQEKVRILKLAIENKKAKKCEYESLLRNLQDDNCKRSVNLPKYEHKVHLLENYVDARFEKLDRFYNTLEQKDAEVKKLVKLRLKQLFKYIFPITRVDPQVEMESSEPDMVSALAEASQTTYIRDRWEYTDYSGEMQYCIIAPKLPGSGNYSAYNVWVPQTRETVPPGNNSTPITHNPAVSISAALTYTAQCVNVLSFYLNVRLPYKVFYSDFCNNSLTEQQFARRVARLNANILYLCFSQNINLNILRPYETIHNILQLVEEGNADLGRHGPIEVDEKQAHELEIPLATDLEISADSDSEEGDSFPVEWEAVPDVQCPEVQPGALNMQSTQMISTQQHSMAGGLVNSAMTSISTLWRGFTGR